MRAMVVMGLVMILGVVSDAATVRIAAAQPKSRLIDWHLKDVDEVLKRVEQSLIELEGLIDRAAGEK